MYSFILRTVGIARFTCERTWEFIENNYIVNSLKHVYTEIHQHLLSKASLKLFHLFSFAAYLYFSC